MAEIVPYTVNHLILYAVCIYNLPDHLGKLIAPVNINPTG